MGEPPRLDVAERFDAVAAMLREHADWWRPRPFAERRCAWEEAAPEVARWLRGLPLEEAEARQAGPARLLDAPAPLGDLARRSLALAALPAWTATRRPVASARGMSPRKRAQVEALAGVLADTGSPWFDWCAGKGYLGRSLGGEVVFVERRRSLLDEALRWAREEGLRAEGRCCDVLTTEVRVPPAHALVALHACGALGDAAIRAARGSRALALVPCCPHAHPSDELPLQSERGRGAGVQLGVRALRFATAEEVTVAPGRRARRRREQAFRLGIDALIREATGEDRYVPLGRVPAGWVRGSFGAFVRHVTEREGLPLPRRWDEGAGEAHGWERFADVRRRTLVRLPFRRLAELFVVLDRACWLQEEGWDVAVGTFCPLGVTPRNILLRARHL